MSARKIILAHGGAETDPAFADGPARAAEAGLRTLDAGARALDAVIEAVRVLEADERFNAGLGANLRLDGRSVHMDAALIDSTGRVASVIGLDDVAHPILVARDLLGTPNRILAGPGAARFAHRMGHPRFDPRTDAARARLATLARRLDARDPALPATHEDLERHWNYEGADTVGAIAYDGETFAAAGSTGGLSLVLDGRVSDIAIPGCGLDANEHGAVCVTGAGDDIIPARVAARVLARLERGASADAAAREALTWIPPARSLAVLVLARDGTHAAQGRAAFPWAARGA